MRNLLSLLQWEEQHRGRSCEDFQNWKRNNDPEYQAQGLALYLQENGIGKDVPLGLSAQSFVTARGSLPKGLQEQWQHQP